MDFNQAFELLIDHEGGYTRNPLDRGNWTSGIIGKGELKGTKYGISAMAFPYLDIKNLTLSKVKPIYKNKYWDAAHCDEIHSQLRFDVFDVAVNSGVRRAIKLMQKALGVDDDGWFGPQTRGALSAIDASVFVARFNGARLYFIASLTSFDDFGRGWVRRIAKNILRAYPL